VSALYRVNFLTCSKKTKQKKEFKNSYSKNEIYLMEYLPHYGKKETKKSKITNPTKSNAINA
jgi:hypothetical protein